MSSLPSIINLSSLNGVTGFSLAGSAELDAAGISVSAAGDVNGDGYADFIMGASNADFGSFTDAGSAYVVFGRAGGFGSSIELSALDGTAGFRIAGGGANFGLGSEVSMAGDINKDGYADLLVGPGGTDATTDRAYVVFGKANGFVATIATTDLDGSNGFAIGGTGFLFPIPGSLSDAGDFNGDGIADFIVGDPVADGAGHTTSGQVLVIYGKSTGSFASSIAAADLDGSNGLVIRGFSDNQFLGTQVQSLGDVNGDGLGDIITADVDSNRYVVFGRATVQGDSIDLAALDGTDGFKITGAGDSRFGAGVLSAGDFNGDGLDDIVIGDQSASVGRINDGKVYVILGKSSGFSAVIDTAELNGTNGFVVNGDSNQGNLSGTSVALNGDINDDGFDDLVIGSTQGTGGGTYSGFTHVLFGRSSSPGATVNLSEVGTSVDGLRINGINTGDGSGASVAYAGDINKDGIDDILIGATNADPNGTNSGTSYVIFGNVAPTVAIDTGMTVAENATLNAITGSMLKGADVNDVAADLVYKITALPSHGSIDFDEDPMAIGATFTQADIDNGMVTYSHDRSNTTSDSFGFDLVDPHGGTLTGQTFAITVTPVADNTVLSLAGVSGTKGFTIAGGQAGGLLGSNLDSGFDMNGDGYTDYIIGSPTWTDTANGKAYVLFGTGGTPAAAVNLEALNGSNGFKIAVAGTNDSLGASVAAIGDVNGDGYDDVLASVNNATADGKADAGSAYIIFGKPGGFASAVDVTALNGSDGFRIDGIAAGDELGTWLAKAGDVNGDGLGDFLVTAPNTDTNATNTGTAYLVYGTRTAHAATFNLATMTAAQGTAINGELASDWLGFDCNAAGDINADGYGDIIVTTIGADPHGSASGAAYVVFGKAGGIGVSLDVSTLDGSNGFKISGAAAGDVLGYSCAGIGDFNNDGYDDVAIGASGVNESTGAVVIVYGKASGFAANIDASAVTGNGGMTISGEAVNDALGGDVAAAGDVNGDGYADIIIGAHRAQPNGVHSGAAYIVYGGAAPANLSDWEDSNTRKIIGSEAGGFAGASVSAAGDLNDDGLADVIVGASEVTGGGAAYVIYGEKPTQSVERIGTARGDAFAGGDQADTFYGYGDNDVFYGHGGDDIMWGHSGNDVMKGGAGNDQMHGGAGDDSYEVDSLSDVVDEKADQGTDTIYASLEFDLTDAPNVENLTLTGAAIEGYGSSGNNVITGNALGNYLDGEGGADTLVGGKGNDLYFLYSAADKVKELAGGGTDEVRADSMSLTLASYANVENLRLYDKGNFNLTGNARANGLIGNDGKNVITGGAGRDVMTGALGRDTFDFNKLTESGKTTATRDVITDFKHLTDHIDLKTLDAKSAVSGDQAFTFIAAHAFRGLAGELRAQKFDVAGTAHDVTVIEADVNGDGKADFQIELTGLKTLSAQDFIL